MSEQITIAGRQVEVKQLTMRQIRDVMAELKKRGAADVHVVDAIFDDDVPAVAVAEATGLSLAELEGEINQQEMRSLLDKVKAVNPFFVGMMARIIARSIPAAPSPTASAS